MSNDDDKDDFDRLLKLRQVMDMTGYGKTSIYNMMKVGKFPQKCKPMGSESTRWSEREVRAWIDDALQARQAA